MDLRLDVRPADVEGDAGRHAQQQIVALADDVDTGARGLAAQLGLLPVHIIADRAAGDRADARAEDLLGPVVAPADEVAEQIAAERARGDSDGGAGDALLAGVGVGRAGGGARAAQRLRRRASGANRRMEITPQI